MSAEEKSEEEERGMVRISFLAGETIFTAIWIALRAALWIKRRKIDWKREALLLLMYVNLFVIIRFTFFPMARVNGSVQPLIFDSSAIFPLRVNIVPFIHLFEYASKSDLILNIAGNVGMFIPSGVILPVLFKKLQSFPRTLLVGAAISLCIEIIQLPFAVRASDVDDLIQNVLGVATGYGIYKLATVIYRRYKEKRGHK